MSEAGERWSSALAAWAEAQPDIQALVQIGSRVQAGATPDSWSDYDYQLITSRPEKYRAGQFAAALGPCWAHGAELTFGNVPKVTAVYEGALEADFVILRHLEVRLALLALRYPGTAASWPRPLVHGVESLRRVAGRGWRLIKGGPAWQRRYGRVTYFEHELTAGEFAALCGQFWVQAVWATKKALRGEYLASQRTLHLVLIEACFRLYEAAARAAGRPAAPLSRRAEQWLGPEQLAAARITSAPERAALLLALRQVTANFAAAAAELARLKRWPLADSSAVQAWLAAPDAA